MFFGLGVLSTLNVRMATSVGVLPSNLMVPSAAIVAPIGVVVAVLPWKGSWSEKVMRSDFLVVGSVTVSQVDPFFVTTP